MVGGEKATGFVGSGWRKAGRGDWRAHTRRVRKEGGGELSRSRFEGWQANQKEGAACGPSRETSKKQKRNRDPDPEPRTQTVRKPARVLNGLLLVQATDKQAPDKQEIHTQMNTQMRREKRASTKLRGHGGTRQECNGMDHLRMRGKVRTTIPDKGGRL